MKSWSFETELWEWEGKAAWYFVTLPFDVADEIEDLTAGRTTGFGSVRVEVTCGSSTWQTSVFPDKKRESFILPIKKSVRSTEKLSTGVLAHVSIKLL